MNEFIHFLGVLGAFAVKREITAKTQRARREQSMNKTNEEIEQIAEQVVDAMLKVHRALGPACWSRRIERASPMNYVAGVSRSAAKLPYP